jgi:hypothetical protein
MTSSRTAAAQFTDVSLDDFDVFLKRAFRALRPQKAVCGTEYCYFLKLSDDVRIKIQTAISRGAESSRGAGSDAIRLILVGGPGNRPLLAGKGASLMVKRTQGWKTSLQNRIEDMVELYEERLGYWESRATGKPVVDPGENQNESQDENSTEDSVRRPSAPSSEMETPEPSGRFQVGVFTQTQHGNWAAKIPAGSGESGKRVWLTRKNNGKVPVTLDRQIFKGWDRFADDVVEVWTIRNDRQAAEPPPDFMNDEDPWQDLYDYDFR